MKAARVGIKLSATVLLLIAWGAIAQDLPQGTAYRLGDTAWQLVRFQVNDDMVLIPGEREKYTIAFGSTGRVSVRFDCNRGRGTWTSSGPGQLQFGPLALTRAMCPPGSLHDQVVKHWEQVQSYTIKDGHLFLSPTADGGSYEFEPAKPNGKVTVPQAP